MGEEQECEMSFIMSDTHTKTHLTFNFHLPAVTKT